MLVQRGVQFIGNVGGREGERGGKAKNDLFALVEMRTGFELRDVAQLLFGDLRFSADGRVDVNSKRTPNYQRIHPTRRKPSRGPSSRDEREEHPVFRDD